jgi:protein-tyrosine phosphatase
MSIQSLISNKYGSKRGLLNNVRYRVAYLVGRFDQFQTLDFSRINRLVFVCSGNICRSPFGEYYARAKGIHSISYGLHCRGGDPADPRSIAFAAKQNIDMSNHITRNIKDYVPNEGDLHLVMEPGQAVELTQTVNLYGQLSLLPLWGTKKRPYLHDPFSTSQHFFDLCMKSIMEAIDNLQREMTK